MNVLENCHTDSILCLDGTESIVASGGEDGILALWDLRDSKPIHKSYLDPVDHTEVGSVCISKRGGHNNLFASIESTICWFDRRNLSQPLRSFENNDECINQMCLSHNEDFVAAANDAGTIQVYDLIQKQSYKRLRQHESVAFTVQFRPRRSWEIVSGGYDSKLIFWDYSKGSKKWTQDMVAAKIESKTTNAVPLMINPPYVLSLGFSPSGHYLACGLNDGGINLLDCKKKEPIPAAKVDLAHNNGVTQVCFNNDDHVLVSGGNDCAIKVWTVEESAADIKSCKDWNHGNKVNWMLLLSDKLLVADVSSKISVYNFFDKC